MTISEFGIQNRDVIIFLHGGGLSGWNFEEEARMLENRYHVILPVLDGHGGSDRNFTTIEDNAEEIINYVKKNHGGSVLMMGGLSLGAQVLLEILSMKKDICRYAIVESAMVIPSAVMAGLISPSVNLCYGLISRRWFAKLQFQALGIRQDLFEVYYRDSKAVKRENLNAFLRASILYRIRPSLSETEAVTVIITGGKEQKSMHMSQRLIHDQIKNSEVKVMEGYVHGDLSLNHAEEYVEILMELFRKGENADAK